MINSNEKSTLRLAGLLVIAWSVVNGLLHLYWLLGGAGYPFQNDGYLFEAIITYLPDQLGGWMFTILCFLGIVMGIEMQRPARVIPNRMILTYLIGMSTVLIVFVPDALLITSMAYVFLFEFHFTWEMGNQIFCILGAIVFGLTALAFYREQRQACIICGRTDNKKSFWLVQWSKWITYLAVFAPLPYVMTRYAWALGIPIGVDGEFLQDFTAINPVHHTTEWVLGSLCVGGALLTLGLIQPWGEQFPAWFPLFNGKRVPILLAVIPAMITAIAITSAGTVFTSSFIAYKFQIVSVDNILLEQAWGTIGPMLTWIPWGVALGLAAIAYYYRRRRHCDRCGRV
ncbi:hypothetical protein J14TS2_08040 [Bacillus sp. J14TS2]|uniref:hypothetical protein n=1 Tax=Bacillus sp. J14TS2 TaxID=2807188 RepID=UPI001B05F511|nr:hypothetical protein [Bacillus sp. J14TS2]GIN70329.1 hypothetical protein J14TS2_08040 [Bacillus sp. J14TS2]